jgi:hypothetical protein
MENSTPCPVPASTSTNILAQPTGAESSSNGVTLGRTSFFDGWYPHHLSALASKLRLNEARLAAGFNDFP